MPDRFRAHASKALRFAARYASGYFERGRFSAARVPRISIETTNICNAKCVFCANTVMQRRKEPLSMDRFRRAVDQFAALGGGYIDFNATIGDPLLDPHLLERARYVRAFPQFGELGFVTTLQWLHRFDLNEFFDAGFTWMSVSTTLSGRDKYLEFFGVDKYEQMLHNLTRLLTENKRRGKPLHVDIAIKPTAEPVAAIVNHQDLQLIADLAGQDLATQVRGQGFYVDDWLGAVRLPSYLKKRPLYPRRFRPCRLLYAGLMVYSNGRVGACSCRDFEASSELILGDLDSGSLEGMWNGAGLAQLRSAWRRGSHIPDICKSCRHYLY